MVRCIILEDTEIKELKFRLVKNIDFTKLLEKKTTNRATDFKLVKILEFNNNSIHIYGYISGEEDQININCIPDIEETLYGDIIVCQFSNETCIDISVEEYEDFYIQMLECDNNDKQLPDIDDMDDDDDDVINNLVINNETDNSFFPEDDIDDIIYDDECLIDHISLHQKNNSDLDKIELTKVNIELEKEEYDYSYIH